jgi:hypothetical protein
MASVALPLLAQRGFCASQSGSSRSVSGSVSAREDVTRGAKAASPDQATEVPCPGVD